MKLNQLFTLHSAKSKGNEDYDNGNIPFITCSTLNNGVIQLVDPFTEDRVFEGGKICISGLGYATLQLNKFLPKGNGGDSLTVLDPINPMTITELIYYTGVFNLQHYWRFSFGRKANKNRIANLDVKPFSEYDQSFIAGIDNVLQIHLNAANSLRGSMSIPRQ